jgi:hypothetical protein
MKIWSRDKQGKQNSDKRTKKILIVIKRMLMLVRKKKLVLGMIGRTTMKKEVEIGTVNDWLQI